MKKFIFALLMFLIFSPTFNDDSAEASLTNPLEVEIVQDDGTIITFPTQEDYDKYLLHMQTQLRNKHLNDDPKMMLNDKRTVVEKSTKNKLFVGYSNMTPNWVYTKVYNVTAKKTHSVSGTYTFSGVPVNISFSFSSGVTYPISADKNRLSRLGGYADITFTKTRIDTYHMGEKLYSRYVTSKKIHDTYLLVKYK